VAAAVLPLLVSYVYFLPADYFLYLLLIVGALAMREFMVMYGVPNLMSAAGSVAGAVLFYLLCVLPVHFFETLFTTFIVLIVIRLFSSEPPGGMKDSGPVITALVYIPVSLSFQWFLRNEPGGIQFIFMLYSAVWIADSTAYYVGKYAGRRKLAPAISPNKTMEGAAGSVAGGAAGAALIYAVVNEPVISLKSAVLTGAVIGVVTIVGDLIESMFKRDAGVKDSSSIIPGHGGLLDKIDGMLVSGPVLYMMVRYL
jgi:phosphatidate cytidylyltransferase